MASMRHSTAIRFACGAPRDGGDHEVFLEDGLTLQAFFEFIDTLPIKRPS
jgi:hypothetical protein